MSSAANNVAFGNSTYVRVGVFGLIQFSSDGEVWSATSSGTLNHLWGVVYNSDDDQFVAVGESGTVLYSDDLGMSWVSAFSGTTNHLYAITYVDGLYVAVGQLGTIIYSPDAETWGGYVDEELETEVSLRSVSIAGGYITVAGDDGYLETSPMVGFDLTPTINEVVLANEQSSSTGVFNHSITEDPVFNEWTWDPLTTVDWPFFVVENLSISENQDSAFSAAITRTEGVALLDRPFINNETLEEAFSLNEAFSAALGFSVIEDILMDESLLATMAFRNTLLDAVDVADTVVGSMLIDVVLSDTTGISDAASASAVLEQLLEEEVSFGLGLTFDDEEFLGLVVNTKSLALTKYTGYNFNSYAKIGERYYGAGADGIYLLEGEDDAGTDIVAKARTAVFDFGSAFQKRVPRAYLGIRGDGEVYLKTILDEDDEKWYRVQAVESTFKNRRVKLGRGTEASYWQFELSNEEDGSFFELQDMALIPVILTRRVKC